MGGIWLASSIQVYLNLLRAKAAPRKGRAPAQRKDRFDDQPATLEVYSDQHTNDCERVLVTLLRGLGPWKDSVYLVGGLTPRYLVAARPPVVPAHAGTLDKNEDDCDSRRDPSANLATRFIMKQLFRTPSERCQRGYQRKMCPLLQSNVVVKYVDR